MPNLYGSEEYEAIFLKIPTTSLLLHSPHFRVKHTLTPVSKPAWSFLPDLPTDCCIKGEIHFLGSETFHFSQRNLCTSAGNVGMHSPSPTASGTYCQIPNFFKGRLKNRELKVNGLGHSVRSGIPKSTNTNEMTTQPYF